MITIFNRRELCVETDMGRFAEIRRRLSEGGIRYVYYTRGSTREASLRGRAGSFGTACLTAYSLYVHKRDYDRAMGCLKKRS